MKSLPDVIGVEAMTNYWLHLTFATGEKKMFNMSPYLSYPAFLPLKDLTLFAKARVEYGTVVWDDELDMSPATLYLKGLPILNGNAEEVARHAA
jgi:hypothetical protein